MAVDARWHAVSRTMVLPAMREHDLKDDTVPTEMAQPVPERTSPLVVAVLLSGSGRTLDNLLTQIAAGTLAIEIAVVISSVPAVRGLEIAATAGIPAHVIPRRAFDDDAAYSAAIYATLAPYAPELILLAGFLRRLLVPPAWRGRILNIHPALLPESGVAGRGMYGGRIHAAVLARGGTISGATVHVVDDGYDTGPVVRRVEVPIVRGDSAESLGARVFAAECLLYPAAIRHYVASHPELFGEAIATQATTTECEREAQCAERAYTTQHHRGGRSI